ncbi:hypothetical protein [Parabacteroides sp. AM08-6]|uniref:hypothetical protein n=1 Tax=Parabacteroides sp. AM08-6 TaxID=2292053 RepID=UPI0011C48443|nr:hypothetical protein [Parabacteroides sp. AM08-6]
MRKIILVIAILSSLILLFFIIIGIIDAQVSYKYEIEGPPKVDCIDIKFASGYLISKIKWLEYFLYYVIVSIVLFGYSMFNKRT